jgi:hypothetical protein
VAEDTSAPLTPLHEAGSELALLKPSWRRGLYELRAGEAQVGLLDVSTWSGASRAQTADGSWRLDRPRGFSQRRVRVLSSDGERELGTFLRQGLSGRRGAIELDGRRYAMEARGLWRPRWVWTSADGAELASLTTRGTFREEKGRATLTDAGRSSPHAGLLLLLGAHLALLSDREAAV